MLEYANIIKFCGILSDKAISAQICEHISQDNNCALRIYVPLPVGPLSKLLKNVNLNGIFSASVAVIRTLLSFRDIITIKV